MVYITGWPPAASPYPSSPDDFKTHEVLSCILSNLGIREGREALELQAVRDPGEEVQELVAGGGPRSHHLLRDLVDPPHQQDGPEDIDTHQQPPHGQDEQEQGDQDGDDQSKEREEGESEVEDIADALQVASSKPETFLQK